MIQLLQRKATNNELNSNINKLESMLVDMDKNMVIHDINRLKSELDITKNKYNRENIKSLIKYLEKLVRLTDDDGKIELCWDVKKDDIPSTYPIRLINEELYKIDICNYITVSSDEYILNVDLTDLANIIAFEFMYKELDETHESIEELLKDCGIISAEDPLVILNKFKENNDNVFELSKSMKVSDTPYMSVDDLELHDYFNTKVFKTDRYKEVVEYSCKYAATLIANRLLQNLNLNRIKYKLLAINPTNIVLIIDKIENKEDYTNFLESIIIRVFGRKFEVKAKLELF